MKALISFLKSLIMSKVSNERQPRESYSQCGEDLIIKHLFVSLKISKPSYIDIGAYHPFQINNTALFYLNGARGINIEPNSNNFELFLRERKRDVNINIGIASKSGFLDYYEMSTPSLNTFSEKEAENYVNEGYIINKISKIKVETVERILKRYWNNQFPHLLVIDVEGFEMEILKSVDYERIYPIVICIETISFSTTGRGKKNVDLIRFLEKLGYLLYADTNINSIFVKKDVWMNR